MKLQVLMKMSNYLWNHSQFNFDAHHLFFSSEVKLMQIKNMRHDFSANSYISFF